MCVGHYDGLHEIETECHRSRPRHNLLLPISFLGFIHIYSHVSILHVIRQLTKPLGMQPSHVHAQKKPCNQSAYNLPDGIDISDIIVYANFGDNQLMGFIAVMRVKFTLAHKLAMNVVLTVMQ